MEAVSLEMRPLVHEDLERKDMTETRLYMQELPSRLARHSASTVMRNQAIVRRKSVGNTVKCSGALRRVKRDEPGTLTAEWGSDTTDSGLSLSGEVLETVNFKAVPLPMSLRRRFKDSLRARAPRRVSKWEVFRMRVVMVWRRFTGTVKE